MQGYECHELSVDVNTSNISDFFEYIACLLGSQL